MTLPRPRRRRVTCRPHALIAASCAACCLPPLLARLGRTSYAAGETRPERSPRMRRGPKGSELELDCLERRRPDPRVAIVQTHLAPPRVVAEGVDLERARDGIHEPYVRD